MAGSKIGTERPPLTVEHLKGLFRGLISSEIEDATLIGGQAAAFWAIYYKVASAAQMTTKDIDLLADRTTAAKLSNVKETDT